MGELTEALFSESFFKQFKALGYDFKTKSPNKGFYDENKRCVAEADCWLEDGFKVRTW